VSPSVASISPVDNQVLTKAAWPPKKQLCPPAKDVLASLQQEKGFGNPIAF